MSTINPFDSYKSLDIIVKNLEKRWGLTLASFLPKLTKEKVTKLQCNIIKQISTHLKNKDIIKYMNSYFNLYDSPHLHCTHITLNRSTPEGPIKENEFIKPGNGLFKLFEIIHNITSKMQPIKAEFNKLKFTDNMLGLLLIGQCTDETSCNNRKNFLEELNNSLPKFFNISKRNWDSDPSKYNKLHCTLLYLKRPLPTTEGYDFLINEIEKMEISPIKFEIEDISLIHHQYRSLAFPQEGSFDFPLGKIIQSSEITFANDIGLAKGL